MIVNQKVLKVISLAFFLRALIRISYDSPAFCVPLDFSCGIHFRSEVRYMAKFLMYYSGRQ